MELGYIKVGSKLINIRGIQRIDTPEYYMQKDFNSVIIYLDNTKVYSTKTESFINKLIEKELKKIIK